jgi:hypothetical protein
MISCDARESGVKRDTMFDSLWLKSRKSKEQFCQAASGQIDLWYKSSTSGVSSSSRLDCLACTISGARFRWLCLDRAGDLFRFRVNNDLILHRSQVISLDRSDRELKHQLLESVSCCNTV